MSCHFEVKHISLLMMLRTHCGVGHKAQSFAHMTDVFQELPEMFVVFPAVRHFVCPVFRGKLATTRGMTKYFRDGCDDYDHDKEESATHDYDDDCGPANNDDHDDDDHNVDDTDDDGNDDNGDDGGQGDDDDRR